MSELTRRSSAEAYEALVHSGELTRTQLKLWRALREHGPMTGNEADTMLRSASSHKRMSELVKKGVAQEVQRRPCKITGKENVEVKALDAMPIPLKNMPLKRPSVASIVRALGEIRLVFNQVSWEMGQDTADLLLWIDKKIVKTPPPAVTKPIAPRPPRRRALA